MWSVSLPISLWAAMLSAAIVAVKRRMPSGGPPRPELGELRAEVAPLPVVGDRDGHLGGLGVVGEAHEASDRDQAANGLCGVLGHQRHMIATVHFGL